MARSKTTRDHEEIKQWAESRGAVPGEVSSTHQGEDTGILRLEFPRAKNHKDGALNEISWEEFFDKFDASGLELVYQEETADGEVSNFNKLVYPEDESASVRKKPTGVKTKAAAKKAPAKKTAGRATGSAQKAAHKKSA